MLAQLVTDEAKPGSKEKWFVDFHPFPLLTWHLCVRWPSQGSARIRSYFCVREKTHVRNLSGDRDKLSALGIDVGAYPPRSCVAVD
jgi:hypothetical protein